MRKLVTALLALCLCMGLSAVPAQPGKHRYTQPDGSVIVLELHGDEYFHWYTDESGQVVQKGEDGYYRPVEESAFQASRRKAAAIRPRAWSSYDHPYPTSSGSRKVLAILVEFKDVKFTLEDPKTKFTNLLNQEGYSYNGAVGSVRDYYIDNSLGYYQPSFDVYGPVAVSRDESYYAGDDGTERGHVCVMEALNLLQDQIDFSQYDTDNNGAVDMVLMYFAGHNQAENAGETTIWPHQLASYIGDVGGKKINRYFCTSEYRTASEPIICGIGTTCHEFAHALGLPDFYDTDYETNGLNSFTTGSYDLMTRGNYNDDGRRPPYLSALERDMLGWMKLDTEAAIGTNVLPPVRTNAGLLSRSEVSGEYYVLECRDNYKWDMGLGDYGLLIYHIDKSDRVVPGSGNTAAQLWSSNKINAYEGHPCYRILPADAGFCAFPGSANLITSYAFKDWDDNYSGAMLVDISFDGSQVSFDLSNTSKRRMFGNVRNSVGVPISGAKVVLTQAAYSIAPARHPLDRDVVAVTGDDGFFQFTLENEASPDQILTVYAQGYVPESVNILANTQLKNQQFYLLREGEGVHSGVYYPSDGMTNYITRMPGSRDNGAVSVRYSAQELAERGLTGSRLESITFKAAPVQWEQAYVVVDTDTERLLLQDISSTYTPGGLFTVDISAAGITVPESGYLYVGFALTGLSTTDQCLSLYGPFDEDVHGTYFRQDFQTFGGWSHLNWGGLYLCFNISFEVSALAPTGLNTYGVASIQVVSDVPTALPPADKTVYQAQWYLDGTPVSEAPALTSLASGSHTLSVTLTYYDGTVEKVYYDYTKE